MNLCPGAAVVWASDGSLGATRSIAIATRMPPKRTATGARLARWPTRFIVAVLILGIATFALRRNADPANIENGFIDFPFT